MSRSLATAYAVLSLTIAVVAGLAEDEDGSDCSLLAQTAAEQFHQFAKRHHLDVADPALEVRRKAARAFGSMNAVEQAMILSDELWPRVRCPEFTAVLLPLLRMPGQPETERFTRSLLDDVFLRLLELRPERVRPLILEDIGRENPLLALKVLLALPDAELPALDEALASHLREDGPDLDKVTPLIERYASSAILPKVLAFYDNDKAWACDLQTAFLRYWLKHDRPGALRGVEKAGRARAQTNCFYDILKDVLSDSMDADAEGIVCKFVADPDPWVEFNADMLLLHRGSAAAKETVINRIVRLRPGEVEFEKESPVADPNPVRDFRTCVLEILNGDHETGTGKNAIPSRYPLSPAQWRRLAGSLSEAEKEKYSEIVAAGRE